MIDPSNYIDIQTEQQQQHLELKNQAYMISAKSWSPLNGHLRQNAYKHTY